MALKGDLTTIGLAEVFQMISMSQKEGTLVVRDAESRKCIYFGDGGVQLLSTGARKGQRLGDLLVRSGKIGQETLHEALESARIQRKLLGEVLLEGGYVTEEEISQVLREQIEEEIYDLFEWKQARFEFVEGPPTDALKDADAPVTRLAMDVNGLLLEAVRRNDEWRVIRERVPSPGAVFGFVSDEAREQALAEADPRLARALELLDGRTPVSGLVASTGIPRFDISKGLSDLIGQGLLQLVGEEGPPVMESGSAAAPPPDASTAVNAAEFLEGQGLSSLAAAQHLKAAEIYREKGDTQRALQHMEKATSIQPSNGDSRLRMCEFHLKSGDLPAAKLVAAELIVEAVEARDWVRARSVCDQIVAADPSDLAFRMHRARLFKRTRKAKELAEELAYIRENLPQEPSAVEDLMRELRDVEEAPVPQTTRRVAAKARRAPTGAIRRRIAGIGTPLLLAALVALGAKYEIDARKAMEAVLETARQFAGRQEFAAERRVLDGFASGPYRFSLWQKPRLREALAGLEERQRNEERDRREREEAARREEMGRLEEARKRVDDDRNRAPTRALEGARQLRDLAEKLGEKEVLEQAESIVRELTRYLRDAFDLKVRADRLEEQGKFREAARAIEELRINFPKAEVSRAALYPLGIRSRPSGVRVVNLRTRQLVGETRDDAPLKLQVGTGETVKLLFEKKGFVSVTRDVRDKLEGEITVNLAEKLELWSVPLGTALSSEPFPLDEAVYVAAANRVYALAAANRRVLWFETLEGTVEGSPRGAGGLVFAGTSAKRVYALDPQKPEGGRTAWTWYSTDRVTATPAPSPDGQTLFVASADRLFHALDARSGEERWWRELPAETRTEPVFAAGAAVVACADGTLVAVKGPGPGDELWRVRLDAAPGPMLLEEGTIFVGGMDNVLYAFDAAGGKLLWRHAVPAGVAGRAARRGKTVFVAGRDGRVHRLDAETGQPAGAPYDGRAPVVGGVTRWGTLILLGSDDWMLTALDARDGKLVWRFKCRGRIRVPPVAGGGRAFFAADETLYAVDLE